MITIQQAQSNPEYMEKFIEENLRFVHYMLKKYNTGDEYEDYFQMGCIGLMKAIKTFKPEKNFQFATYASRIISNEIQMYFRRIKKYENIASLDASVSQDEKGNELTFQDIVDSGKNIEQEVIENISLKEKFDLILSQLNEREKRILKLHISEKNQAQISNIFGISQGQACKIIAKIHRIASKTNSYYERGTLQLLKTVKGGCEKMRLTKEILQH